MTPLLAQRSLFWRFVECDIKVRYKQVVLGVLWAIVSPLAMLLIFIYDCPPLLAQADLGEIPYPVYVYCGILLWSFFSGALAMACTSLVNNLDLITTVYFRRELLPFARIGSRFVDGAFQEQCFEKLLNLKAHGTAVIIVSHRFHIVERVCDRALLLNNGCIEASAPPVEMIARYRRSIESVGAQD